MLRDYETEKEFLENLKYAHDFWAPFVQDASIYTLAQSGYTWTHSERQALIKDGREPIEYNIMRRPLQFYSGYLRDNANSIVIGPVEGSDQKTADQLDKVSSTIWNKGGGFPNFLNACDESFKSGISLCGLRMDYTKDFINGDLAFFMRPYNAFYLDPTFSTIDLKDCGFAILRDLLDRSIAKGLLPFIDPQIIDDLPPMGRDNKFIKYHPNFSVLAKNKNIIAYDQYYRRTTRRRRMLTDLETGYYVDITDEDKKAVDKLGKGIHRFEKLRREADSLGIDPTEIPKLDIRTVDRPYIELCIMLNGKQVYVGEDKTQIVEKYPFAPCVCYLEPSIWTSSQRLQGVSSTMWSLQRQFNKRHMKIIDMMDSDIATGYAYLLGAVPDPADLQQTGQSKIVGIEGDPELNPHGLDAIRELRGGASNPAIIEYQRILDELSLTLANITESVLGIDEKGNTQISGRLAQVRIAQGLRSNRKMFDNIEEAQEVLGGLVMLGIQKNYPPGKIERMIDEKPTEQFYDTQFEQYDAVIKEGVRSKSQKDAYYYELVNLKKDQIVDVPESEIVRALQMSGLSDLEEAIEKQDQQKAEQQQKIDQQEQMVLKLQASQIEANTGLAQERRGRVISDVALAAERASEAEENRAQAALARAKTITEIATMESDNILKVMQFVEGLEQQEQADRDNEEQKIYAKADMVNQDTQGSAESDQVQQASQSLEQGV